MDARHLMPPEQVEATTDLGPETWDAFSADGVDVTLIRWMLGLTPTERLQAAQDMMDTVWKLREGRETY